MIARTTVVLIACGAFAGALALAKARAADEKKPAARPALTVSVVRPQVADVAVTLEATGNIAAWQETIVGAEVNGLRLTEVRVNVGDRVKRGDVLAIFAPDVTEAESAQQAAVVKEAEAALEEARSNANRRRSLAAAGAASAQEVEQYVTAERTAEARLGAARAAALAARVRLGNTRVVAPDDGVISTRTATVGAVAQPGQELFRLIRNSRLEWRAEVTAAELGRVKVGQRAVLTLPGGGEATGKVRMLAPTIDPLTRNAIVYVDLVAPGEARAGMFARGRFELGRSSALTVPQQALVVRDGYSYVYVVGPDQRVQQRKVKTGRRNGDRVEITEGLAAGVAVVAAGAGFLNDGDLVVVVDAPGAAPAKAAK